MDKVEAKELVFLRALSEMREALPLIGKTTKAYKYKYSALENICEAWEPVFHEHGFMLRQSVISGLNGEFDVVCTKLTHLETGLSEESSITLPVTSDYQAMGSGITYYKRYGLVALGKQVVGEDFDGLKSQKELDSGEKAEPKPKRSSKSKKKAEEPGPHLAYREFLKDVKDVKAIEAFYQKNRTELQKLKESSEATYDACIAEFRARKTELQNPVLN